MAKEELDRTEKARSEYLEPHVMESAIEVIEKAKKSNNNI